MGLLDFLLLNLRLVQYLGQLANVVEPVLFPMSILKMGTLLPGH